MRLRTAPRVLAAVVALAAVRGVGAEDGAAAPPRVAGVVVTLPPGEDRSAATALLAVSPGDPLSSRALRTTVQRLFQTGRFRNVIVRATPVPAPPGEAGAWVELGVEALAVRRVVRVAVRLEGLEVLPERTALATARLSVGEPFEEGSAAAAAGRVRAELARRGYRTAQVDAVVSGDVAVVVELVIRPGRPTRVRSVRLEGEAGPATAALGQLATRSGAVLDEDDLAADARRLRVALEGAGYRRARVGAPRLVEGEEGVDVVFPVAAGPRLAQRFRGNAVLSTAFLEGQLGLDPDQPVDAAALEAAAERIRDVYRVRGFAAASVEVEERARGDELVVIFHVTEGSRYRLEAIGFEGVEGRGEGWLREQLVGNLAEEHTKVKAPEEDAARMLAASQPGIAPPPSPPAPLAAGEYYTEAAWDRAGERIAERYRGEGFLEAAYLGSRVALDAAAHTVQVTVRFREGPQTLVEAVVFEGNQALSTGELSALSRLAPGDGLAWARAEETRSAILRRYASLGHVFARVETREELDRPRHLATLRYVVEEGPQVRVGRILFSGNRRTREEVIRDALQLREGKVYDPEAAARSQAALLDTGVFRSASLRLEEPDAPQETKDLVVELGERPYATLTSGIGFSIADGPRTGIEYVRPNVMGRAVEVGLRGKINYPTNALGLRPDLAGKKPADRVEGQFDLGARAARRSLLPFPVAGRSDLIGELVHRPAYDMGRISAVAGVDANPTPRVSCSLQYQLEVDRIDRTGAVGNLTEVDQERLRFDEGTTTLHSVRSSLVLDFRDNSAHPRRGWLAAAVAEYAHSLGSKGERILLGLLPGSGIHTNMVKLSGTLSGYLPVASQSVLAVSVRAGQVFPLDGRSRTIIPRRFFLGGASTLRGFGEDELIQEDVRPALAAEAARCAVSTTDPGCTDRGQRVASGKQAVSEGGEAFLLGKAELRVPVAGSLEVGLFFDAGNLWLDPTKVEPFALRPTAGLGLRFVTPIGPAVLDLGFNLDPDRRINEAVFAPHFTIGMF